ncbi:hypothetical protein Q3G72_031571 [Acer saccharum]|nr:hypothetical protein Q3G72_031571 [Acer saccharum]
MFYKELRRLCIGYNEFRFSGALTVCVKLKELKLTRQVHGQVLVIGFLSNLVILSTLVDAYARIHGNMELGRKAAERLIELEPQSSAAYVLLSSIYAALGKWELVEKVRRLMDERQVKKERAISWIEIENNVHTFTVSDRLHPLKDVIYSVLEQLGSQMEEDAPSIDPER